MQLSGAYPELSDTDLDALYATTYASFKNSSGQVKITWATALAQIGMEITERLTNVKDFVLGVFGHVRFPQFDAIQKADRSIGGFQQSTEAQTSMSQSASNVGQNVKDVAKNIGLDGIGIGVAAIVLLILLRRK